MLFKLLLKHVPLISRSADGKTRLVDMLSPCSLCERLCVSSKGKIQPVNHIRCWSTGLLYIWLTEAGSHWCDYGQVFGRCDNILLAVIVSNYHSGRLLFGLLSTRCISKCRGKVIQLYGGSSGEIDIKRVMRRRRKTECVSAVIKLVQKCWVTNGKSCHWCCKQNVVFHPVYVEHVCFLLVFYTYYSQNEMELKIFHLQCRAWTDRFGTHRSGV